MVQGVYLVGEAIESNNPLEDATVYFAFAGLIAFVRRCSIFAAGLRTDESINRDSPFSSTSSRTRCSRIPRQPYCSFGSRLSLRSSSPRAPPSSRRTTSGSPSSSSFSWQQSSLSNFWVQTVGTGRHGGTGYRSCSRRVRLSSGMTRVRGRRRNSRRVRGCGLISFRF